MTSCYVRAQLHFGESCGAAVGDGKERRQLLSAVKRNSESHGYSGTPQLKQLELQND